MKTKFQLETSPKKACGGRISVTELPNEMGISLEHVEARVEVKNLTPRVL